MISPALLCRLKATEFLTFSVSNHNLISKIVCGCNRAAPNTIGEFSLNVLGLFCMSLLSIFKRSNE